MEGIHQNGKATFTAGAAIAKGEFVKFSNGKVVKCVAATDIAIGVALDGAEAGAFVPVQLLTSGDTVLVKAGGAVAQGGTLSCLGTTVDAAGAPQSGTAPDAAENGELGEAAVGLPAVTKIA